MITVNVDGTSAMNAGLSEFSKAASAAYSQVSPAERETLRLAERTEAYSVKDIKKEGKRIFLMIQKQVNNCLPTHKTFQYTMQQWTDKLCPYVGGGKL